MSAGLAPLSPRADAAMLGTGKKGCTEPEESQSLLVVHTRACFATSQLGPHWTTRCSSEIAKAADACGTLGDAGPQGRATLSSMSRWVPSATHVLGTRWADSSVAAVTGAGAIDRRKHGSNILGNIPSFFVGRDGIGMGEKHSEDMFPLAFPFPRVLATN